MEYIQLDYYISMIRCVSIKVDNDEKLISNINILSNFNKYLSQVDINVFKLDINIKNLYDLVPDNITKYQYGKLCWDIVYIILKNNYKEENNYDDIDSVLQMNLSEDLYYILISNVEYCTIINSMFTKMLSIFKLYYIKAFEELGNTNQKLGNIKKLNDLMYENNGNVISETIKTRINLTALYIETMKSEIDKFKKTLNDYALNLIISSF